MIASATAWLASTWGLGWVRWAAFGLALAGTAYASHAVTAAFKDRTIVKMQLAQQTAITEAWKTGWKRRDQQEDITREADLANARNQGRLEGNTKEIIRNVPFVITREIDARCTLPVGFVRLLDAAALGIAPADLPNRSAEPDGADSGVPLSGATALLAQALGDRKSFSDRLKNARDAWGAQAKVVTPSD